MAEVERPLGKEAGSDGVGDSGVSSRTAVHGSMKKEKEMQLLFRNSNSSPIFRAVFLYSAGGFSKPMDLQNLFARSTSIPASPI